jgi:hypothetical protein
MRQVHRAGEKTFVDYSGRRPSLIEPGNYYSVPHQLVREAVDVCLTATTVEASPAAPGTTRASPCSSPAQPAWARVTWTARSASKAGRAGLRALDRRMPRLFDELTLAKAYGTYAKLLRKLTRAQLLILDDLGLGTAGDTGVHVTRHART